MNLKLTKLEKQMRFTDKCVWSTKGIRITKAVISISLFHYPQWLKARKWAKTDGTNLSQEAANIILAVNEQKNERLVWN